MNDAHRQANETFLRAVTGGWCDLKMLTIVGKLTVAGVPDDVIDKTTTAIVTAINIKHGILHRWQDQINRWHQGGDWQKCADLGDRIQADIDEAVTSLAPYAGEEQALANDVFQHLPEELQQAITQ